MIFPTALASSVPQFLRYAILPCFLNKPRYHVHWCRFTFTSSFSSFPCYKSWAIYIIIVLVCIEFSSASDSYSASAPVAVISLHVK
jgi:hypothetical protein